ncbi:hypothetical protein KQX54_010927 [Cotesia glomerata]|uniref:Uncharacterized protein n=1 Tax=Cotesia glomerata TaxID=32391 RepID=A0AAV7J705_COTGL|nr:hypothetical protein KQX54_010927 [Cotesia glomerata]
MGLQSGPGRRVTSEPRDWIPEMRQTDETLSVPPNEDIPARTRTSCRIRDGNTRCLLLDSLLYLTIYLLLLLLPLAHGRLSSSGSPSADTFILILNQTPSLDDLSIPDLSFRNFSRKIIKSILSLYSPKIRNSKKRHFQSYYNTLHLLQLPIFHIHFHIYINFCTNISKVYILSSAQYTHSICDKLSLREFGDRPTLGNHCKLKNARNKVPQDNG